MTLRSKQQTKGKQEITNMLKVSKLLRMCFMGFLCQEMSFVYNGCSPYVGQGKKYQGFYVSVKYFLQPLGCLPPDVVIIDG